MKELVDRINSGLPKAFKKQTSVLFDMPKPHNFSAANYDCKFPPCNKHQKDEQVKHMIFCTSKMKKKNTDYAYNKLMHHNISRKIFSSIIIYQKLTIVLNFPSVIGLRCCPGCAILSFYTFLYEE